jgi:hypothetical protein
MHGPDMGLKGPPRNRPWHRTPQLHSVAPEYLLATLAQLRAIFLQTLLNRVVVAQLLTAKINNAVAGSKRWRIDHLNELVPRSNLEIKRQPVKRFLRFPGPHGNGQIKKAGTKMPDIDLSGHEA